MFDVYLNQVATWRTRFLEESTGILSADSAFEAAETAIDVKTLHAIIGELLLGNDFLAGALGKVELLASAKR